MRYETIREATQAWVREFNAYPQGIIEMIKDHSSPWDFREITMPCKYDKVYIFETGEYGEITSICKNDRYRIQIEGENKQGKLYHSSEFEVAKREGELPMWSTMWTFGDGIDDDWLSGQFGENGLKLMSECGFRIYKHEEFGYFFGIDGAGYDFYESHWIPLYKARGLHWHNEEAA